MRWKIIMFFLCLAGAVLNVVLCRFSLAAQLGLYLDTIFTAAVTFTGGFFWGALCGALTNIIYDTFWFGLEAIKGVAWKGYLFIFCNIAVALITRLFIKFFPRELSLYPQASLNEKTLLSNTAVKNRRMITVLDRIVVLVLLSFALCLAISILGGLISAFILITKPSFPEERGVKALLSDSMFISHFPLLFQEIAARIPVNIIDRIITAFGGYGISLGLSRLYRLVKR